MSVETKSTAAQSAVAASTTKNNGSYKKILATVSLFLKLLIFICLIGAATTSRLFSVIRYESIIHEFDPWFNYRATRYLVANGFHKFLNWFDDRTWYPLGRVTGGTLYPGLMTSSGFVWYFMNHILKIQIDIRNVCVLFAPAFSGITAIFMYLFTKNCYNDDAVAGFLSAAFIAIAPGYISRSVAGSYDNEAIAITLLMSTFYLWIKAMRTGSIAWACSAALSYFYMVSAWGGYVFITNLVPLHVFILLLMGRYSSKIYSAYSVWYCIGTLASMQIPFVGFLPIRSNDHMASLGVFGLLQFFMFGDYIKSKISSANFKIFLKTSVVALISIGVLGVFSLTYFGLIAPWTGRFYSLWDTDYAKIHIPIIASVSEHQPTAWPSFFFDTQFLIWLFPCGVFLLFMELQDEHVFIIVYSVLCSYFAGVMVRLMLTLTPIICACAAIALSNVFKYNLKIWRSIKFVIKNRKDNRKSNNRFTELCTLIGKLITVLTFLGYLILFVQHCTWVTSNAYSSPSVVLQSGNHNEDGSPIFIDDFREAYSWLRYNTAEDSKVAAWWDYGYQIGGMADRTTLVDNNTWNNTHIAIVGKAMASEESISYEIFKEHDVDYVLIIFGGLLGYSGDDINKFLWMVRISEGIWPEEINEPSFFTPDGQYRVDSAASETMKNCLMYKMSYHDYPGIFGNPNESTDRVRGATIEAKHVPDLKYFEEVFTSENWLVRIYKLKDEDSQGRDLADVYDLEHNAGKKVVMKKPKLEPRIE
ncbi:oligosaccharyl transferase stt3 subunit [Hanseniaspora valbyensis]